MEDKSEYMDLEKAVNKIFSLDGKIRFVEIVIGDKKFTKTRPGLKTILTPSETEESINDSLARWTTRRKLANKLGEPLYAFAEYEKVKRLTIPINDKGLILVSIDSNGFHEVILKEIIEVKNAMNWNFE